MTRTSFGLALCALLSLGALACDGDEPRPSGDAVQEVEILDAYPESTDPTLFARPQPTMQDVLEHLWKASDSTRVKGLLVRVGPLLGAWGRVGDLTEALNAFREDGRPVHCHFEVADNVAFILLATACDQVSMSPAGTLDLVGPAAIMIYARSLLQKIGIEAEIVHMGRYKGAGDMLIRDDMPPEAKQSMDDILDDLYAAAVAATSARQRGDETQAKKLIDRGPFVSGSALEAKLVDNVSFLDQARDSIRKAAGVEKIERVRLLSGGEKLTVGDFLELLGGDRKKRKSKGERVVIVQVTGNIVEQEWTSMGDAASGPFIKAMERFKQDDGVKAMVLRIDSPGGSALASDRMWHAAKSFGEAKPLLVSVGDMAASGGYYIASAADQIFAHPNSLVGSIGVVGGKLNIEPLTREIGVRTYVLQRGKRAAWATLLRGLDPTERRALESMLRDVYDRFIDRVAAGRNMERARVLLAAEGRLMTAQDAKPLGLIDELAGLNAAVEKAKAEGGLPPDAAVEVWPSKKGVFDALTEAFGGVPEEDEVRLLTRRWIRREAGVRGLSLEPWAGALALFARESVALVPPFVFALR